MATRCFIAKPLADETYAAAYCHCDGYPEGVGRTLLEHYQNDAVIDELISLRSFSSLRKTVEETREGCHKDAKKVAIFDYDDLLACDAGTEFVYIWITGSWFVYETLDSEATPYPHLLSKIIKQIDQN